MKKLLMGLLIGVSCLLALPAAARGEQVSTSAVGCIIIDADSGRVLLEHNAHQALPMASTTKVMTALLAIERGNLTDEVTCSRNAFGVPGTSIYLSEGETLTLEEMLYGLMMASGNDAATAIAEHIGGTVQDFCLLMTERARELGCENTVFLTPHGLPCDGHHTTCYDLALIAREAMTHPVFRQIVSTSRAKIPWEGRDYDRVLNNKNRLLTTYEGATGIKTGYTKAAGRCLVFGAERNGLEIIGVVLNCYDWFNEAARLMNLAFERYESQTMLQAGDEVALLPVNDGLQEWVSVRLESDLKAAVPINALPQVEIALPEQVEAPIQYGDVLGVARMMLEGETLAEVSLVAAESVLRDDFNSRWQRYVSLWPLALEGR